MQSRRLRVRKMPAGHIAYSVHMYIEDGQVQNVHDAGMYEFVDPDSWNTDYETETDFVRCVAATSEEHAVKVVNEMRTIWKAQNNWKPPVYN
jgi:hypothetical protein